jgi:hypothetical protein
MSDRCYSTLICARPDASVFEKMGYTIQGGQAITIDGNDIPGAVVMITEEAENGKYDELTSLQGIPFIVYNGCCSGCFGDHLIASSGTRWQYSEALHESSYPAVRVDPDGAVQQSEVDAARKYWAVYKDAIASIRRTAAKNGKDSSNVTTGSH